MKIYCLKVGKLECNCYILTIGSDALVIDPGDNFIEIDRFLKDKRLLGILITHHHFDHVGALEELVKKYNVKVYDNNNLEEKIYKISNFSFEVIYTPGHSNDSITFYFRKDGLMFGGDFIFYNSIGRCDLETSNEDDMKKSLYKIIKYSDDTLIYPGHGIYTSLGYEKNNNPFLNNL